MNFIFLRSKERSVEVNVDMELTHYSDSSLGRTSSLYFLMKLKEMVIAAYPGNIYFLHSNFVSGPQR